MTVDPSVCLFGRLARLLSITSCAQDILLNFIPITNHDLAGTYNELATDTICQIRDLVVSPAARIGKKEDVSSQYTRRAAVDDAVGCAEPSMDVQ